MASNRYRIEPLGQHHNRAAFSCGVVELDRYFHQQANQDVRRSATAVWVLSDTEGENVAGYYTLGAFSVDLMSLSQLVARRLPRYPILPALLVGRLAVNQQYRGQGFGEILLFDALHRALNLTRQLGTVAVIVDAKSDDARVFCKHFDFQRFQDDEFRLYIPMKTIAEMFRDET